MTNRFKKRQVTRTKQSEMAQVIRSHQALHPAFGQRRDWQLVRAYRGGIRR